MEATGIRRRVQYLLRQLEEELRSGTGKPGAFAELKRLPPTEAFEALTSMPDQERRLPAWEEALLAIVAEHRAALSDDQILWITGGEPPDLSEFHKVRWYTHPETGALSPEVHYGKPSARQRLLEAIDQEGLERGLWIAGDDDASSREWLLQPEERNDVSSLISKLDDSRPEARATAARILGRLGDPAGIGRLIGALKDGSPRVRSAVADALSDLRKNPGTHKETLSVINAALWEHSQHERSLRLSQRPKLP